MDGRSMTASADLPNKFTGKEHDDDFGLDGDYFGARYYDAVVGRWCSVDPFSDNDVSMAPFHYTHNNPISRFDPDGRADFGSAKKLRAVGMKILNDPALQPRTNTQGELVTFCNFGCREILQAGGDNSLDGKTANQIFDFLSDPRVATPVSFELAAKFAGEGATVLLSAKDDPHGHVAVVAPGDLQPSGTFGKKVPLIFNFGKRVDLMKASFGFRSDNQPKAFILNKDRESVLRRFAERKQKRKQQQQANKQKNQRSLVRRIFGNVLDRLNRRR